MAMTWLSWMAVILLPTGCNQSAKNFTYLGQGERPVFKNSQLQIDSPDEVENPNPTLAATMKPRTCLDRNEDEVWDLSLVEAIHLALVNNRIARTRNEFLSPGNTILQNPEGVTSIYDPAIRETGFLFGNRGVESALAAFDPVLGGNVSFGNSELIQNNPVLSGGIPAGRVLNQDTAVTTASITKQFAYGAQAQVSQTWNYNDSNQPFQLFPSVYTGNILFNYTQPLWQGSGTEFNRIAGPLNNNIQGVSGLNQGVVISRINTDISLAQFQAQVRNMVHDVEDLYWELYLAYRNFDALVIAKDKALNLWRSINAKFEPGVPGGGRAEVAQAQEAYYEARGRAEAALAGPPGTGGEQGIYGLELQLRRMCGLPTNDGRIIRPCDEPSVAEVRNNWDVSLATAFAKREELRQQRWNVKSIELQLKAAENLANPQLNLVSSYQVNGFGKDLFGDPGKPGTAGAQLTNYTRTLYSGNQTGWNVGLQFSMPIGLRNAHATVRNTELRLMKAHAALDAQEVEICHEVASSFQKIDFYYQNMQTTYNRRESAAMYLAAVQADFDVDRKSVDALLQAQNRQTIADMAFYRALVEYNKALTELQMRQGTLLEYNNIHLSERGWVPDAKVDAARRAWARSYAFDAWRIDPVHQEPEAMVPHGKPGSANQGPMPQGESWIELMPPELEPKLPTDMPRTPPTQQFPEGPSLGPDADRAAGARRTVRPTGAIE